MPYRQIEVLGASLSGYVIIKTFPSVFMSRVYSPAVIGAFYSVPPDLERDMLSLSDIGVFAS